MSDEPVHMLEENCEEISMAFGELKLLKQAIVSI